MLKLGFVRPRQDCLVPAVMPRDWNRNCRHQSITALLLIVTLLFHDAVSFCFSPSPMRVNLLHSIRRFIPAEKPVMLVTPTTSESDDWGLPNNASSAALREQAKVLFEKAKVIRDELKFQEEEIEKRKRKERSRSEQELDRMINSLFPAGATPINVAGKLRKERWSQEQIIRVAEALYHRKNAAAGTMSSADGGSTVASLSNSTDSGMVDQALQTLMDAVALIDKDVQTQKSSRSVRWSGRIEQALQSRLKELMLADRANLKRRVAAEVNSAVNSNRSIEEIVRRVLSADKSIEFEWQRDLVSEETNQTGVTADVVPVPLWIPPTFLPYMLAANQTTLGSRHAERIKDKVLLGSRFYVTTWEYFPGAAIFRGNLRTPLGGVNTSDDASHAAMVFSDIQQKLEKEGLQNDVQLFLLPDPEWNPRADYREKEARPVVLALSKAVVPDDSALEGQRKGWHSLLRKLSLPAAAVGAFLYSIGCYSLNRTFFDALVNQSDIKILRRCIPVFLGICGVHVVQEAAHFLVAKLRKIKLGFPMPIPGPRIGILGSITPLRSFPPDRSALLDLALVGPLATALVSILCVIGGVNSSLRASSTDLLRFPVLPAAYFKSSFLIGNIVAWIAPKILMVPLSQPIPIHPLFVVGFAGLFSVGLNLLPIFRLDGGRACSAALGHRQAGVVSAAALLFILSLVVSEGSRLLFSWLLVVCLFQRQQEISARDEVTEVDTPRLWAWLASFGLSLSILTPFPGASGFL